MLCYYKETFTLGFVSAFFVFVMMTIFEDVIYKWFEEFKKFIEVRDAWEK